MNQRDLLENGYFCGSFSPSHCDSLSYFFLSLSFVLTPHSVSLFSCVCVSSLSVSPSCLLSVVFIFAGCCFV